MQFRGHYYFLSNFYPSPIEIDGLLYESAEAAFQGQKNSQYAHMFTGSVTPLEVKRLGKCVPIDVGEWNARRLSAMRMVVRAKFEHEQDMHQPADGTYLCGLMHPHLSPSPDLSFVSLFSFPHHLQQ